MSDTLLFRFAQEELVYLLRALQIGEFPGLEDQPLGKLDADHQALALAVADRSLRARGIVRWEGGENRAVDPITAGLLRDAAHPDYTLLADLALVGQSHARYLYTFSSHAAIEHWQPEPGIHQLLAVGDRAAVMTRLRAILQGIEGETPARDGGHDTLRVSRACMEHISTTADAAEVAHLLAAELPADVAGDLALALRSPRRLLHLALWWGIPSATNNRQPMHTLTLAQHEQLVFVIEDADPDAVQLGITSSTIADSWLTIEHFLRDALSVLPELLPQ